MSNTDLADIFQPRSDRRIRNGMALAALVVLVAAVAVEGIHLRQAPRGASGPASCGAGVVSLGGECVGVDTDGRAKFDALLAPAQACIQAENDWVQKQGKAYVTIAFLGPLTSTTTQSLTTGRVPHELEGACTAQHRVNQDSWLGDHPLVQLVLANEGSNEGRWREVVDQLEGMTGGLHPLVAVIGLGLSQDETVLGAKSLSDHHIPMVGDVITADGLDSSGAGLVLGGKPVGPIPGLTRVAPTTSDELAASASYVQQRTSLRTAIMVTDTNTGDRYTQSLADAFRHGQLASYLAAGGNVEDPFDGSPGTAGVGNDFTTISNNLCGGKPPDMVFYAGRELHLPAFLTDLSRRTCRTDPITVVTGSDAAALTLDPTVRSVLGGAPISVLYTALADPTELDSPVNPSRAQYTDFESSFGRLGFAATDVTDGWGIMAHDAMATATIAIRHATGSPRKLPSTTQVRDQLYYINAPNNSVPGAGGTFQLSLAGDPVGRPLPVFKLSSGGPPVLVYLYTKPLVP
jgi:hypothetical protein